MIQARQYRRFMKTARLVATRGVWALARHLSERNPW